MMSEPNNAKTGLNTCFGVIPLVFRIFRCWLLDYWSWPVCVHDIKDKCYKDRFSRDTTRVSCSYATASVIALLFILSCHDRHVEWMGPEAAQIECNVQNVIGLAMPLHLLTVCFFMLWGFNLFPASRSEEGELLNSPSSVCPSVRSHQRTRKVFVCTMLQELLTAWTSPLYYQGGEH